MKQGPSPALAAIWLLFFATGVARADVLEMQNGDRYSGRVLAISAEAVVLNSEILGKIQVPRNKVATLTFTSNGVSGKLPGSPAPIAADPPLPRLNFAAPAAANTNADLSAALRQLGGDTNVIAEIRNQFLAGSPEAGAKFDQMVSALLGGQMNIAEVRRQAQDSANQLRDLKKDLGPDADEVFDAYLKILDAFVSETSPGTPAPPAPH